MIFRTSSNHGRKRNRNRNRNRDRDSESVIVWARTEIDTWSQGLTSHRNQKQYSKIRWIIGAKTKTIGAKTKTMFGCAPVTIDYWTHGLVSHRNQAQYSTA